MNCGDKLNTSLKTASNILRHEEEKKTNICNLCAKFEVYVTPASVFLATDGTYLTNMQKKYFLPIFEQLFISHKWDFKGITIEQKLRL